MRVNRFAVREIGGVLLLIAAAALVAFGVFALIVTGGWPELTVLAGVVAAGVGWRLATYDPSDPPV